MIGLASADFCGDRLFQEPLVSMHSRQQGILYHSAQEGSAFQSFQEARYSPKFLKPKYLVC